MLLAMSLCVIAGLSYIFADGLHWLIPICCFVISPLLGYLFTYKGAKNDNQMLYILSVIFYSIFISSFLGALYGGKKIPMNLLEIVQLSASSFMLISIIYILVAKFKGIVFPALIGIILISLSSFVVWRMFDSSFISEQSLWYSLAMLILVLFHYIVALIAKKKDINIVKAISNGFGGIFWIIAAFATDGVGTLPTNEDEKYN